MTTMTVSRRNRMLIPLAALVAGALVLLWWRPWSPDTVTPPLVAAADYSGRPTVCLASSGDAQAQPTTQTLWRSIQDAAKGQAVNVQRLAVPAATRQDAAPYLAGLIAQHCNLIVTVGPAFGTSIPDLLASAPDTRFIAVDAGNDLHDQRISRLTADDAPAQLATRTRELAAHR